jgi:hypothetical protein
MYGVEGEGMERKYPHLFSVLKLGLSSCFPYLPSPSRRCRFNRYALSQAIGRAVSAAFGRWEREPKPEEERRAE